jgi:hypothetical protein
MVTISDVIDYYKCRVLWGVSNYDAACVLVIARRPRPVEPLRRDYAASYNEHPTDGIYNMWIRWLPKNLLCLSDSFQHQTERMQRYNTSLCGHSNTAQNINPPRLPDFQLVPVIGLNALLSFCSFVPPPSDILLWKLPWIYSFADVPMRQHVSLFQALKL